jgi:hypothetical protein
MPTSYCVNTTKCAKYLVDNRKHDLFEGYINGTLDKNKYSEYLSDKDNSHNANSRVYYLVSHAIDKADLQVLDILSDKIDLNYIEDGNDFYPISLAIDNVIEGSFDIETMLKVIDKICDIAQKRNQNISDQMNFATKFLLRLRIENEELFNLIDIFVDKNINLWSLYHFSLVWDKLFVTEYLFENYSYKIDRSWDNSVRNIAKRFGIYDKINTFLNDHTQYKKKNMKKS